MTFTPAELEYLASQRLGRLATIGANGVLMNNPVRTSPVSTWAKWPPSWADGP